MTTWNHGFHGKLKVTLPTRPPQKKCLIRGLWRDCYEEGGPLIYSKTLYKMINQGFGHCSCCKIAILPMHSPFNQWKLAECIGYCPNKMFSKKENKISRPENKPRNEDRCSNLFSNQYCNRWILWSQFVIVSMMASNGYMATLKWKIALKTILEL